MMRASAGGRLFLLLLAASLLPYPSVAKEQPARHPALLDDRHVERSAVQGKARIGLETGVPRALWDVGYAVTPADPETMARQYLRENRNTLRLLDPGLSDLSARFTRRGLAGTTVRFEQRYQGVPVLAPDVAVTIDRSRVTYVANGYEPGIALATTTAAVTAADARAAALARLSVQGDLSLDRTRLVVAPAGKESRLAWEVRLIPMVTPPGDWQVLVDARTGEIFRVVDLALYINGSGYVYDADPLSQAHALYGAPGYVDGNDVTTPQLDAARVSRTLLDITDIGGGTYKLQGPYAQIVDIESPFKGLFTQASTTFNYDRANDAFEAANTYYHIDHVMRYLNNTLGVSVVPYQYVGGVRYDPSGFNGADNSHYLTGSGTLSFGEGGVDDAEDSDVVIHELGHGIHDWVTGGGLSQVDGLSEGLGDFACASYSRSLGQWSSGDAHFQWTFDWDGHNPFWPGRVTNDPAHYPEGLVGEVHEDGQIWVTSLMKIWDDVGQQKADKAVWEGIAMTNAGTSQDDAAHAVLQAAISLGYTSGEIASFVTHFQATGYSVSAGVDYVSHSIVDQCPTSLPNVNGVAEPGEGVEIRVVVNSPSFPQTGVTGVLTTSTPGVTIIDNTATWNNLAPGVPTQSNAPHFKVVLGEGVPCLSAVNFNLTLTSNEGGPYPMSFAQNVGASLTPSGLPLSIPDNNPTGVTSTLAVGSAVILSDVNVRVQITHTYVGDLFLKLRSPLGTEVVLLDRPGFPATTFGCGNDNMDVTFDDASGVNLETWCAGTNPWYSGPGHPTGTLASFNGQSTLGNWVLTVSDNAGSDVGTVTSWQLITTPAISGQCTVCSGAVDVPIVSTGGTAGGRFELSQNRPNPFSPQTEIRFQLPQATHATLAIYDVAGRLVSTLVDGETAAGPHVVTWDGTDRERKAVSSGIYFYRLASGNDVAIRRMQLLR